jgi:RecA-family ATPase
MNNERNDEFSQLTETLVASSSTCTGSNLSGDGYEYKMMFEALLEINRERKQEYQRLKMQYEYEKRNSREFIYKLEERRVFLVSEIERLAAVVVAQQNRISKYTKRLLNRRYERNIRRTCTFYVYLYTLLRKS